MKKRAALFAIAFVGVLLLLVLAALFSDHLPRKLFSPADGTRAWALTDYNAIFIEPSLSLPTLLSDPEIPQVNIDTGQAGMVVCRWSGSDESGNLHRHGERIEADENGSEIELPNGQVLRLIAVAHVPPASELPDASESAYFQRDVEVAWCDPNSLAPIENGADLGLPAQRDVEPGPVLFLAFSCSDSDNRPLRWQFPAVFDDETKLRLAGSMGQRKHGKIVIFDLRLRSFHSAPLRISMPVSYGKTDEVVVDQARPGEFRFANDSAVLQILHAQDGYANSSSWGGDTDERHTTFRFDRKHKNSQQKSFSVFCVAPPVQGKMMERFIPQSGGRKGRWTSLHPNNGLDSMNHAVPLAELKPNRYRRFPELARAIFEVPGISNLARPANLFDVTVGPIRFDYENDFRQAIEGATALEWIHYGSNLDDKNFPLFFHDPATTPADLLERYEELSGVRLWIDQKHHKLVEPDPHSRKKGIGAKILDFFRRIF